MKTPTPRRCDADAVLIPLQRLVDRIRQPRSRADEVADVRTRVAVARRDDAKSGDDPGRASARQVARGLAAQRVALSAALGDVRSCTRCARGRPLPAGRWDGGHCCSGRTAEIFTDEEVLALALAGTTPARLVAPPGDHAGCAFRGETGCSLDTVDRPSLCVRYLCREIEGELAARGDLGAVRTLAAELVATLARFRRAMDRATLVPLTRWSGGRGHG
jgi:hypothetical protein